MSFIPTDLKISILKQKKDVEIEPSKHDSSKE